MYSFILLSTLNLAPVAIVDASANQKNDSVAIKINTNGFLPIDQARGKVESHAIRITLKGSALAEAEQFFGEGRNAVRARKKGDKVELKIPLQKNVSCSGPVHFEMAESGLAAVVACPKGDKAVTTVSAPQMPAIPTEPTAAKTTVNAMAGALASAATPTNPTLPSNPIDPATPAERAFARAESLSTKPVVAPAEKPSEQKAVETLVAAATAAPSPTPTPAPATTAPKQVTEKTVALETMPPQSVRASSPTSIGAMNMVLPAAVLLALAAFAIYAARRRPLQSRTIQIVETAHLGPKRSLVVARIGNETLLLGTSEAGITLLSGPSANGALGVQLASVKPMTEIADRTEDPAFTRTENKFFAGAEKSGLAGLLQKFKKSHDTDIDSSFEDLLVDSAEDDELRRKLARGITGRVS